MRRRRFWRRKILCYLSALIAVLFSARLLSETLPMVSEAAGKAAVISAGLALPEGGQTLLDPELDASPDEDDVPQAEPTPDTSHTQESANASGSAGEDSPPFANISQEQIDQYPNNDGPIIRKQYGPGDDGQYINISGNAYVRNMTDLPNETVAQAVKQSPAFTLDSGDEPQVLIMHTHTTESYELTARDFFDASYPSRSLDNSINVVAVGDQIANELQRAGIGVIHDTTVHDYPAYNGAYDRSKQTVEGILSEYPSIKVVLDIHRDAIGSEERYAPVANINGRDAAQIMIISGCDDGTMDYPNYLQNLAFASLLQQQTESDWPGLTRPISFKYKYYNQSLTTGSLLVEVGSNSNSIDEALYSGWLFGQSLARALKSITQ